MTPIADQLHSALACVAALDALGCRVICVTSCSYDEHPTVQISDPEHLLDHLDAQFLDTNDHEYIQRGVVWMGCKVLWIVRRDTLAAEESA